MLVPAAPSKEQRRSTPDWRRKRLYHTVAATEVSSQDGDGRERPPTLSPPAPPQSTVDATAAALRERLAVAQKLATVSPATTAASLDSDYEDEEDVRDDYSEAGSDTTGVLAQAGSERTSFCLEDRSSIDDALDLEERLLELRHDDDDFDAGSLTYSCATTWTDLPSPRRGAPSRGSQGAAEWTSAHDVDSELALHGLAGSVAAALRSLGHGGR